MNICFVCNGLKTKMFYHIAEDLKRSSLCLDVFFICCSSSQQDYLSQNKIAGNHILLLNWDRLTEDSEPVNDYKLNELVAYDRALKYNIEDGLRLMRNMEKPFHDFILENQISFVFGEMTWAHEILMARICQDKFKDTCHYLHPQSIRIPNGRFCFMDTEFQDSIFSPSEYIHSKDELKGYQIPIQPVVPQRVADVAADVHESMTVHARFKHLLDFLVFNRLKKRPKHQDSLQTYILPLRQSRKKSVQLEFNKIYYMNFVKKAKWEDFKDKKYVFVTLHMQPEASVDVVGRYYDDQLLNIKNLWRIMPQDYYIVVKEHTNAIGNRGKAFFKELQKIRNVIIPDENISSHLILNNSDGVFTNSGTVALEAGLYRKHAFLFSGIFFDKLKYCHRVSLEDFKYCRNYHQFKERLIERDKDKMDLDDYSDYIIRSSFKGIIDPHQTSNLFEDTDNIRTIARSFEFFLNKMDCKCPKSK